MNRPTDLRSNEAQETFKEPASFRKLVFAAFTLTGIITTIVGPILPHLSARWGMSDARAGLFFTAQFVGSITGVAIYTVLAPRRGLRFVILAGYLTMMAGIVLFGVPVYAVAFGGMYVIGISLGLVITGSNLFIASAPGGRRASAVSLLNVAWGVGAVLCPILLGYAVAWVGTREYLTVLAGTIGAVLLALFFSQAPAYARKPAEHAKENATGLRIHFPQAAMVFFLFCLYVGVENSFGGWCIPYAARMNGPFANLAKFTASIFWASLLVGRILAPALLRRLSEFALVQTGLALMIVSSVMFVFVRSLPPLFVAVALGGLGCATIYPILVTWLTSHPGVRHPRVQGFAFAAGNLGGASLPPLVGAVSTRFGGLEAGFGVVVAASVTLLLLSQGFQRSVVRALKQTDV